MAIEDDVMPNPLIRQHDAVTSESEHVTDDATAADENEDRAERLVEEEEVTGELKSGKAGQDERSWGKTGKRKWGQNGPSGWGNSEDNDREGRKWGDGNPNAWGKRPGDLDEGREKRKWGENTMSVWGKRGKVVDNEYNIEKRKWGENTMGVWGKKRPRVEENASSVNEHPGIVTPGHKPDVTQTAGSSSGTRPRSLRKRSVFDHDHDPGNWYGRFDPSQWTPPSWRAYPRSNDGPKRKWETNTMRVWGKRSPEALTWEEYPYSVEPVAGKRQWTSDNVIRIWGKRVALQPLHKDEERPFDRFYEK